jgi:hypothetical protein
MKQQTESDYGKKGDVVELYVLRTGKFAKFQVVSLEWAREIEGQFVYVTAKYTYEPMRTC